ncbi:MAG TPA: hypothetical protein VN026_13895 [Bacteroidia bacterium]|jgi:hypothetical protein|nr:hypothetical protein [Bacteroidia bacterium]
MTNDSGWIYRAKNAIKKEAKKEFIGWSEAELIDEILEVREELSRVRKQLQKHEEEKESAAKHTEFTEKKFQTGWSNPTKIAFLLYKQQKPMTSLEIEKEILKYDQGFKDYSNPTLVLSTSLLRMTKSGRIKRIKLPGIRTYFFGLPQWFTKEGELKKDFELELRSFE